MKRHVIAFEGFHKRFRHAVAFRTLDRGSADSEPQVFGKTAGFMSGIARSVIGEPFDRMGKPINGSEPGFHTLEYQVPDAVPSDPSCGGHITQNLPITGIQTESDPNPLSGVTGNLKDIGAPATVGRKSDHPSFMGSFRPGYSSGQQKGVPLQDPIDPLVIDRKPSIGLSSSVQNGLDPSVPIGRSPVDNFPQRGKKSGIVFRRGTRTLFLIQSTATEKIRPGNFQGAAYHLHRESFSGKDGFRAIHFFSWATSSASWRISTSMVF